MNRDELFLLEHEIIQMGKTQMCIEKWINIAFRAKQKEKKGLLLRTPTCAKLIPPPDAKAAERAKRYIWSRIERNQGNSGRTE